MNRAIIDNNMVVNIIVADAEWPDGIALSDECSVSIGDTYDPDTQTFTSPVVVSTKEP